MKSDRTCKRYQSHYIRRGMAVTAASLFAFFSVLGLKVEKFRTNIDSLLGIESTQVVTEKDSPADYSFTSDYNSTGELLDAIESLGERMSEEGTVLLKNNGALPLSDAETKKVSLLGYSSYYPVQGGDMGSCFTENKGTDADTVDLKKALEKKGFVINPVTEDLYEELKESYKKKELTAWGAQIYYRAIAPEIGETFRSYELSKDTLETACPDWKDSMDAYPVMIITLARASGENHDYTPGEAGVDQKQNLNQSDPLGLSDTERDIINAAVDAKKANNGKVIVLLNNANAMEIDEIKENDGVDAILQVGLPGGYGFYGVADILSGAANPSGHLSDTYAVDNSALPAVQNYGNYEWTNADPSYSINSELVEAEGIYTGYKYYETRYTDVVLGQGNASDTAGSSTGGAWNYEEEVSYPFGYGLSYTTFSQKLDSLDVNLEDRTVTANVTVTNTGDVAGKDAVQLYVSVPYTEHNREHKVEKAAVQLLDYGKTKELQPEESVTVTITADAQDMTSWDSLCENAAGTTGNYILDAGDYYFAVGADAHEAMNNILAAKGSTQADGMTGAGDAENVKTWNLKETDKKTFAYTQNGTAVENQLQDMDLNSYMPDTVTYLSRSDWSGTWPKTYKDLTATDEMIQVMQNDLVEIKVQGDPDSVKFGSDNGLTLNDLKGAKWDDERWDRLLNQLTLEECMIRIGFGGTATKPIKSIVSPKVVQNDGPNGIYSYPLGCYANINLDSADPCAVKSDDPNLGYMFGTMCNETVIAQTFSKELAGEYGKVTGNYSLWSNLTILWGAGVNLHRTPYNARNHEYYSEDSVLTAGQAASYIAAGKEYGCIIAPKHIAFNNTEIHREGIATFLTEQNAREGGLRAVQKCIENAGALGLMTSYNRIGCTASNAHYGLMVNILRDEWGFKGLISEDCILDANYSALKEAVHCGITMTCNTGADTAEAIRAKWNYWTAEKVSKDATMLGELKQAMKWQCYAVANSNAMDGMNESTKILNVATWYDRVIMAAQVLFGILTLLSLAAFWRGISKDACIASGNNKSVH